MTPSEKAADEWSGRHSKDWAVQGIMEGAFLAGVKWGREEMRERAEKEAEKSDGPWPYQIAESIRNLPDEPEGEC